jgi:hypothetical protein
VPFGSAWVVHVDPSVVATTMPTDFKRSYPTAQQSDVEAHATPLSSPVPAGRVSDFQVAPASVVDSSTPSAVTLEAEYVMFPPTTQQSDAFVQVMPASSSMPDGTLSVFQVVHPSVVDSTTGTPLESVASAQQSEATGHDMAERLVRPLEVTVWVAQVLPPSAVATIMPGPP